MRLLYVHLPRYLALRELHCPFRRTGLMPDRRGTLNFVVGLNGTGKSSLLRAIFQTFQRFSTLEPPRFAITLAYALQLPPEVAPPDREALVVLDKPANRAFSASLFFYTVPPGAVDTLGAMPVEGWQQGVDALREGKPPEGWPLGQKLIAAPFSELGETGLAVLARPHRVLAYSSGQLLPWHRMREPECRQEDLEAEWSQEAARRGERPAAWSPEAEEPHRMRAAFDEHLAPALSQSGALSGEELAERLKLTRPAFAGNHSAEIANPGQIPPVLLLEPEDLPLVRVALGLWHTAVELRDRANAPAMHALREQLRADPHGATGGARRILRDLNWAWATHLSLRVNPEREPDDPNTRSYLLALHGLSLTVTRQPLERRRLVLPLGPRGDANPLEPLLKNFGVTNPVILKLAERADVASTGADAICRLFSPDGSLWPLFEQLRAWRAAGWLEEATLTVLRTEQLLNAAGNLDDSVLCLEDFSDGEQMLLARMGMFFLLQNQRNTLLLMDEPETHFNDSWKREIVEMLDEELLRTTACHGLLSTHSSIALSDVFGEEVTVLRRLDSRTVSAEVAFPLFGADPSRIMTEVFDAPQSIGARAYGVLENWLKNPPVETAKLTEIVDEIGGGLHRAELRRILLNRNAPSNSPPH